MNKVSNTYFSSNMKNKIKKLKFNCAFHFNWIPKTMVKCQFILYLFAVSFKIDCVRKAGTISTFSAEHLSTFANVSSAQFIFTIYHIHGCKCRANSLVRV